MKVLLYKVVKFVRKDTVFRWVILLGFLFSPLFGSVWEFFVQTGAVFFHLISLICLVMFSLAVFMCKYEFTGETRWVASDIDVHGLNVLTQEFEIKDVLDEDMSCKWLSSIDPSNNPKDYFPNYSATRYYVKEDVRLAKYGDRPLTEEEVRAIAIHVVEHEDSVKIMEQE